jgi:hypothetical protein
VKSVRICLAVLGTLAMGYAVLGALTDPDDRLAGHLVFLLAVLAAHDAVVLPVAIGLGVLLRRYVPAPARRVVQAALVVSVAVAVVGIPLALGYGRPADNPSALPLDYVRGLLAVLAAVWLVADVTLLGARLRARRPGWPSTCPPVPRSTGPAGRTPLSGKRRPTRSP